MSARDILSQEEINALLSNDFPLWAETCPLEKISLNLTNPHQALRDSLAQAQKGKRIPLKTLLKQPMSLRLNENLIAEGYFLMEGKDLFFLVTSGVNYNDLGKPE